MQRHLEIVLSPRHVDLKRKMSPKGTIPEYFNCLIFFGTFAWHHKNNRVANAASKACQIVNYLGAPVKICLKCTKESEFIVPFVQRHNSWWDAVNTWNQIKHKWKVTNSTNLGQKVALLFLAITSQDPAKCHEHEWSDHQTGSFKSHQISRKS